jgi:hypothetical protein
LPRVEDAHFRCPGTRGPRAPHHGTAPLRSAPASRGRNSAPCGRAATVVVRRGPGAASGRARLGPRERQPGPPRPARVRHPRRIHRQRAIPRRTVAGIGPANKRTQAHSPCTEPSPLERPNRSSFFSRRNPSRSARPTIRDISLCIRPSKLAHPSRCCGSSSSAPGGSSCIGPRREPCVARCRRTQVQARSNSTHR